MLDKEIKEQHIHNMLSYLATKSYSVSRRNNNVFVVNDYYFSTDISGKSFRRENYSFTINFDNKTISLYAYDVGGHNGDHFNCESLNLDWDHIFTGYNSLINTTKSYALEDELKNKEDELANRCLEKVLSGNF